MKKILTLVLILFPATYLLSQSPEHSFIGVEACAPCHKTEKQGSQIDIWKKSQHSKAYETLKTEEANKIAVEKGFNTPAIETDFCLKCHTSAFDSDMVGEKFKIEDGVQCETCHGPGSEYKSMKVMKSHAESVANGLTEITDIESFCKNCHNPQSPTYKDVNLTEAWETIKHPVPEKK
jgi:hypothetical protein